jgi:hypothetical protein
VTRIDLLKKNFQRLCEYSWDRNLAGAQRIWLAVYDKEDCGCACRCSTRRPFMRAANGRRSI